MENEAQLSWEARFGRPAAVAAFGAIIFQVASFAFQVPAIRDQPGRNDPLFDSETLLTFHAHSGVLLGSAIAQAIGTFFAVAVLFYLFRATRHRRSELPQVVQWVLVIAPVLLTLALIANWTGRKDAADQYTTPGATTDVRATPSREQRKDVADFCKKHARPNARRGCRATRGRREAVAKKLLRDNQSPLGAGAGAAGAIGLAFSYVIIALNAMRAGLLSRFMGILGVIVGALIVLPLLPQGIPVVQIFWLGGLGLMFLGAWPRGRGPAWETGEAIPWPVPERPGITRPPEEPPEPEQAEPAEEPARPHPVSKKRKRKRRR